MMQSDIKIAITGGIGSGKSTVGRIISDYGYCVFSCDAVYAEIVRQPQFVNMLATEFGKTIRSADGGLDRGELSRLVFSDCKKLKRLNEITHPLIMEKMFSMAKGKGLCFFEVPLLFECDYEDKFDGVIVVLRDREKRIAEVVRRDGLSRQEVCARMCNQFDYDNAEFDGYFVIHNDGTLETLNWQVADLLSEIASKQY